MVQIESAAAVGDADQMAGLDGVDVLFVGPRDLSHELGVPGDLSDRGQRRARPGPHSIQASVTDGTPDMKTTDDGYAQPGIGLISVGWMGKLHSRAYQAIPQSTPS